MRRPTPAHLVPASLVALALACSPDPGPGQPVGPAEPDDRSAPNPDAAERDTCLIPACQDGDPTQPGLTPRQPYAKVPVQLPAERDAEGTPLTWQMTVKFVDAARVRVDGESTLRSEEGHDVAAAQAVVEHYDLRLRPAVDLDPATLADVEARARAKSGRTQPDFAALLIVELDQAQGPEWAVIGERLQALEIVEFVSVEATHTPPPADIDPTTPDLEEFQGYLGPDPGVDVDAAWAIGLRGEGIRLGDIEYGWNTAHEDLVDQGVVPEPGQTPTPDDNSLDHGTAVVGITSAGNNGYGITGGVSEAQLHTFPELSVEGGSRRVAAILSAVSVFEPGDVLMYEMQIGGPNGPEAYIPAEYAPAVHMATRTATDAGVLVVAAAGNGNQNLDAPEYAEYMAREDSGALIVGAGSSTVQHTKMGFSTYGSRVDIQGWGTNVFTLGGGTFEAYGDDYNQAYNGGFNGTSSAVPVVSNAVVVISQYAQQQGVALNGFGMRNLLVKTAIPTGADDFIGPFPNIANGLQALEVEDVGPPTVTITAPGPGIDVWIPEAPFETDIEIEALDETFVASVGIEIAGDLQPWTGLEPPYVIEGVTFPEGDWTLRARAEDVWGNVGESELVTLHVGQEEPEDSGADEGDAGDSADEIGDATGDAGQSEGDDGKGCSVSAPSSPRELASLALLLCVGAAASRRRAGRSA
ncbi:putative peptidase, S8 (subtilisin) family protein [Plesiocystis pacifica SIR-1]|uniref:Putative peptidase, S8 (Subtilisin) family protein n=1 Tax=Plesiocystis pacifica SIR-1 TaxID=391625 RepID=A6GCX7_9BACT|nr:S8 family peptidase [Plesiocystis pacifica]EDM76301.1 putative peptidase, S8 (subtilisin) family protein [Plesiocystis pacifica SIR-1]